MSSRKRGDYYVCTRDVRIFLSIKGQLVFCGEVDKGFHGREISDVSIADLAEQGLQVPTAKKNATSSFDQLTVSWQSIRKTEKRKSAVEWWHNNRML